MRERVADLARLWLTRTGARLDFHFWTAPDVDVGGADIRIAFDPARGSWSWVGTQATRIAREKPTMNLGWMTVELPEDQARSVVLHEFGHAIGLIHEHLHPLHRIDWDRERVIADLRASQGWDDATISANMFEEPPPDAVFATAFDPSSIMMYAVPEHWTRDDFSVGWNTDLSASDIGLIQEAYGVRPEWRG
ncbi:MAG: hypothetical protein H7X93_14460 [Sphingomonadaceae bacterium]|nr:hypothetical protein [Sphingomonadaceae bacterium]